MNRIRAALPWRKKSYYGDSDSTGYCSSSEVSKALSDSQFILRPNTALLTSSFDSTSSNYYALDYSDNPRVQRQGGTVTSRSSSISTTTFKSRGGAEEADDEKTDEESTIRANSVRQVPMMAQLTSFKHLMEGLPQQEEIEDDVTMVTMDSEDDDDVTLDVVEPSRTDNFRNSSFRSFPFSYQLMESEMDRLFGPSSSKSSFALERSKKRLLIREPTSTIYYHDHLPTVTRPTVTRTESVPRGILKSHTSPFAIYEEIYGDHLTPPPTDIRPQLPERPIGGGGGGFKQFPTVFQPQRTTPQRAPSVRRRKKMPSLHHSTSFASYFRRKK